MGKNVLGRIFEGLTNRRRSAPGGESGPSENVSSPAPPSGTNFRTGVGLDMFLPQPLTVATVYCCVDFLSDSVASLPVQVTRRRGGILEDNINDSLHYLLNVEPDEAESAFGLKKRLVMEMLLYGNAYIVPFYSAHTGGYTRLALCGRGTVSHDTTRDIYTVSDLQNGIYGTFGEADIIHIKGMPGLDPKTGRSVVSYARETSAIAKAGNQETLDRFENGGVVRGLVGNDTSVRGYGEYQDKELARAAEDIEDLLRQGRRIVSRPGQVDFKQFSMTSADMEFLSSRKFTVREICRFFRVHPTFVFDDTSNNYKSAEMAKSDFLSNTLNPLLRKIENELERKLIGRAGYGRRGISFDRRGLFVSDLAGQADYLGKMIAAGLYTPNEARESINRAPLEGGDKMLVSANLRGIDEPSRSTPEAKRKETDKSKEEDGEKER